MRKPITRATANHGAPLLNALRTLVKAGHPGALAVLGFGADSPVVVVDVAVEPDVAAIGDDVHVSLTVENPSDEPAGALLDLVIHFVKANGSTSPKVFKGAERHLEPGEQTTIRKKVSLRQHSTRTHHPGTHRVDAQLNGVTAPGPTFEVTS